MSVSGDRPIIFLSYSHEDEVWKERLVPHLRTLEMVADAVVWHDRRIDAGADWYSEITETMAQATAAVCLVSADYLASDFCEKEEIPYLLERREKEGMLLVPLLIRPCTWDLFDWLRPIQMLPRDGKSVAKDFGDDWDSVFEEVTRLIHGFITTGRGKPTPSPSKWPPLQ